MKNYYHLYVCNLLENKTSVITINETTLGQMMNDSEIFAKVKNLLYQKYPEYKETEQYIIVNEQKVNRFKL